MPTTPLLLVRCSKPSYAIHSYYRWKPLELLCAGQVVLCWILGIRVQKVVLQIFERIAGNVKFHGPVFLRQLPQTSWR